MTKSCSRMVRQNTTLPTKQSNLPQQPTQPKEEKPMAAKGIATGIDQLLHQKKTIEKQSTQLSKRWKEIRNQIDAVLMSNNVMKSTDVRVKCLTLDQMTHEARQEYIKEQWGPLYLNKVQPLLQQLQTIEQQLLRTN